MKDIELWHGDCLDLAKNIPRHTVDLVIADLPYATKGRKCTSNQWDVPIDLNTLWHLLLAITKKTANFIFHATQPFATALINSNAKLFRYEIIWKKTRACAFACARTRPLPSHENILIFGRRPNTYNAQKTTGHRPSPQISRKKNGISTNYNVTPSATNQRAGSTERFPLSVQEFKRDDMRNKNGHPTQKPLALTRWLIETYSNNRDVVFDPTMGSGTTGHACALTGRKFIGIEQNRQFFDIAVDRVNKAMYNALSIPKNLMPQDVRLKQNSRSDTSS